MIIDTHCHYNLEPLYEKGSTTWETHWQNAQAHDVTKSIVIGVTAESSSRAVELAKREENFFAAVGLHPHTIDEYAAKEGSIESTSIEKWMKPLSDLLTQPSAQEHVVAIGETGLDYFHLTLDNPNHQKIAQLQKELFIEHIKLADSKILPLILHVRDHNTTAYKEILDLLTKHKKSNLPFVLHCVSGSVAYVQAALELGAYIGIAGNVTYKNAENIRDIVRSVPKDRILLETDAPYLPPTPHRGKICEPWMIQLTGEYLKEELQLSLEQIYTNTLQVFPSLKTS